MIRTWLYAFLTTGALIQFPVTITIQYGLPDPAAILASLLMLFGSILAYDIATCTNEMSLPLKYIRFLFSPLSYVATVHHGQFEAWDPIIILSGLLAFIFAMDPLSSIQKFSRWAGKYTAWYSNSALHSPSHQGDFEMAFALLTWIGALIATPLYFIRMW